MADLGSMVVKIVGDMTGFTNSLTDTQKKMAAFGVNATAIIAVVAKVAQAATKAVKDFTDYGSAIYDASQKTGLSTDAIQEWKFIAEQTGGTLDNVTGAVAMMTRGLATNADEFVRLGIETRNADGTFRSTTEIFNDTIERLSGMADETERDQLAFKLLGRSAQTLIPILNAGASGIAAMRKEANELGLVLDEGAINNADNLGDSLDALGAATKTYSATLVDKMAPALISVVDGLKDFITATNDAANVQKNLSDISSGAANIDQMSSALRVLNKQLAEREANREKAAAAAARSGTNLDAYDKETEKLRTQARATTEAVEQEKRRLELAEKTRARLEAERAAAPKDIANTKAKTAAIQEQTEEIVRYTDAWTNLSVVNEEIIEETVKYTDAITNLGLVNGEVMDEMKRTFIDWATLQGDMLDVARQSYTAFLTDIGTSLGKQQDGWKDWGNIAIDAIGQIVMALGAQLAALSGIALFEFRFGEAAALAAGAVAAVAAGAAIKNYQLAEGGIVQPQPGGIQATIAEAGMAEAVIPLDRLDRMLETAGGGSDGGMTHLVVNVDSRPILDKVFAATRNRTVLIDSGAVV